MIHKLPSISCNRFCIIYQLKSKWLCGFKSLQYRLCDGVNTSWYFFLSVDSKSVALKPKIICGRTAKNISIDLISARLKTSCRQSWKIKLRTVTAFFLFLLLFFSQLLVLRPGQTHNYNESHFLSNSVLLLQQSRANWTTNRKTSQRWCFQQSCTTTKWLKMNCAQRWKAEHAKNNTHSTSKQSITNSILPLPMAIKLMFSIIPNLFAFAFVTAGDSSLGDVMRAEAKVEKFYDTFMTQPAITCY